MQQSNEKYYYINVEDSIKYGLVSAAIISRVQFWCEYNEKNKIKDRFYDGYWWSGYLTSKHLGEQLGISHKTIENHHFCVFLVKLVSLFLKKESVFPQFVRCSQIHSIG